MATWVSYAKARRDPKVRHGISENLFKKRVLAEVIATPSWARRMVGAPVAGNLNIQIDVTAAVAAAFVAA
jgi:hypothetical protein